MGSSPVILSTPFCTPFTKFGNAKLFLLQQSPSSNASFKLVRPFTCTGSTATIPHSETVTRRSANYPPPIWDDRYIQSLTSVYSNETHSKKAEKLKNDVRLMIQEATKPSDKLHLIDNLQRLGLSYHFEDIIETSLRDIYYVNGNDGQAWKENDLYTTSLQFRLFRDHGFHVPQDVFVKFTDESGDFKPSILYDTIGLLALYEASYLSVEGEPVLDKARDFSTRHLVNKLQSRKIMNDVLAMQVTSALEIPLHWRMLRNQAREFIELYEQKLDMNPVLLELAKLDFNLVQSIHQKDLKTMSRWWRKMGLAEKLPFARNRLLENFFGTTGLIFEPQQGHCRQILTKIYGLATVIDDMYDVYGTLEELQLFTDAVERWDVNTMDELPDYMKTCFLALFNSTNEMAYETLKEHGYNPISQMKKAWADLTKAYMTEARWYQSGYTPTFDEYLNIACISIVIPTSLVFVFFSLTNSISEEALACLETSSAIIHCPSLILRLCDDLGTSSDEMKRGDVPKSMQCYMNETGASQEEARAHIVSLISETFKKMNNVRFKENRHLSKTFIAVAMNICRSSIFVYKHGDGFGHSNKVLKKRYSKILIEPFRID